MANPPPVRPWFRLTSIRPVPAPAPAPAPTPAPAPAPAPEPRPTLALPTFRTASTPHSPQTHSTQPQPQPQEKKAEPSSSSPPHKVVPSSHSSSLPSSPLQKAPPHSQPPPTTSTSSPDKTATHSPKTIKQTVRSPIHSPKSKPTAPPPSPLTLPPSQLKTEQEQPKIPMEAEEHKAVLVQKTVDNPEPWHNGNGELHRETRNHSSSQHGKQIAGKEKETKERKGSDSEDFGMRVITIAGENRGAYMELINSPKKHEPNFLHKKGNSKSKVNGGGESENSSAEEGNTNKKDKNQKGRTTSSLPVAAYMNSDVQCVNNSLLYHASCSHHDPGVRLSLSKKPYGEGYHLKDHVDGRKNT